MKYIDISGPQGNAFVLMGIAQHWMEQIDPNMVETVIEEMKSSDYNHLLETFNKYFGGIVTLASPEELPGIPEELYTIKAKEWI